MEKIIKKVINPSEYTIIGSIRRGLEEGEADSTAATKLDIDFKTKKFIR